ncbi:MAG: PTS system mannose/fructose/sorbose family transporter subunit IID [Syntrophales bacterium]
MTRPPLIQVFARSLLIQASFNYWRMQNLGFAFAMIPVIRRLSRDRKDVSERLNRHMMRFHTHPCMAPSILGSVVCIEETGGASAGADAVALKDSLMGPYAALGDPLFLGGIRPLSSVSGVFFFALGMMMAAPLCLLGLYNVPSLWIRWRGLREGYKRGRWAFEFFQTLDLTRWTSRMRWAGLVALAIVGAVVAKVFLHREGLFPLPEGYVSVLAFLLAVFWLIRRGVPRVWIPYGIFVLFLIVQAVVS